jgi:hypothetical protein
MKDFLDNFAAVIGAATLALLLFSVCHEYGYFSVIGSQFQTFVSTTDYFTNSTQWIVFALFTLYGWLDWNQIVGSKPYYSPLSKNWRTWIFPGVIFSIFILEWFFTSRSSNIEVFFIFSYLWLVYGVKRFAPFAEATEQAYKNIRAVIIAAPVLAVLAYVIGQQKAEFSLSETSNPYQIKIKGGSDRNRILLRNFDKGLLVRSPADERIEFIKWDQIEEVSKLSPKFRGESYACRWLGITCSISPVVP